MYNILICDDEQDIVNALKIYLSGGDYCLFEASNGREALEVVEKNDIHLILMDIMMPQLDGIAATAKLREKSNVPIILLTAKSESSDKVLGLNIGADDYITKPFDPVEVLARVRSQLRRYTQLGSKKEEEKPNVYTVGPIVPSHKPGPREELLLRRCYTSCLEEATSRKLDTLAFCCISTGVFGYPQQAAARVAIDAVRHHLDHNDPNLKVTFNVFLASDESIYRDLLQADR